MSPRHLLVDLLALLAASALVTGNFGLGGGRGVFEEAGLATALFALAAWALVQRDPQRSIALRALSAAAARAAQRPALAVGLCASAWAALVGAHAALRYSRFQASAFDLSIFDQAIWATSRGDFLRSSIKGGSLLADHFGPLGALLAPLFWIWDDPRALVWAQAVALASGAVPLHRIARRELGDGAGALVLPLAYLCLAPLRHLAAFDFHTEALEVPLFLWAFERLGAGRPAAFAGLALAAACGKESGALAAAGLGVYAALATPHRRAGIAVASLGAAVFILGVFFVPRWVGGGFAYFGRYAADAEGAADITRSLVGDPARLATFLFWPPRKLEFLARLLLPLALLPLLGWRRLLVVVPVYAALAASTYPPMQSVRFQYTTELIPFLCWAAVEGLRRLAEGRARAGAIAAAACALAMVGRPETARLWALWRLPERAVVAALLEQIPREESVAAQAHLAPRLGHRSSLVIFPARVDARWIAVEPGGPNYGFMGGAAALGNAHAALPSRGYVRVAEAGGVELWRRGP